MIELRISEAAALSIVEQADYYEQASDRALAQRWEAAVDQAIHSLLNWPERGATWCSSPFAVAPRSSAASS